MIAYDNAGNERKSREKIIRTERVPDAVTTVNGEQIKTGAITFTPSDVWSNYQTSVTIGTNSNKYYIEYKVNSTEGTWTRSGTVGTSITASNLNFDDTIYFEKCVKFT